MKTTFALIISALTTCLATSSYGTPTLGVDYTSASSYFDGAWNLGFEFQVTSPVIIDGLAFLNATTSGDPVGLWNSSGTLLASANVTSGDPTIGNAGLNYATISPVTLQDGDYVVSGNNDGTQYYDYQATGVTTAPEITWITGLATPGSTFADPVGGFGNGVSWFAGDIVVGGAASTPDSGTTIALMGMALAGLGLVRRKLQN